VLRPLLRYAEDDGKEAHDDGKEAEDGGMKLPMTEVAPYWRGSTVPAFTESSYSVPLSHLYSLFTREQAREPSGMKAT